VVERDLLASGLREQAGHERLRHLVALERAAKAQVEVGLRGNREHFRKRNRKVGVQLDQRHVAVVQRAERRLGLGERGIPDEREDAPLLVAEERADREGKGSEAAVEKPDDRGEVVAELGVGERGPQGLVSLVRFERT